MVTWSLSGMQECAEVTTHSAHMPWELLGSTAAQATRRPTLVHPNRLAEAVERYMDYEALGYWARPALERGPALPQEVASELRQRCQGSLDIWLQAEAISSQGPRREWEHLMLWIGDHLFDDAKIEGWCDAHSDSSTQPSESNSHHGVRRPLRRCIKFETAKTISGICGLAQ